MDYGTVLTENELLWRKFLERVSEIKANHTFKLSLKTMYSVPKCNKCFPLL